MNLGLDGKVVLVTGASGAIGRALAEAFAAEGARLGLHANAHPEVLDRFIEERGLAGRTLAVVADVRQATEIRTAVDQVAATFGRLDVCVINAGIWPAENLALHELPETRLREVLDVNLVGALHTARAFVRALARTGPRADGDGASVILIGSTAGRFGERGHAEYAVAKAGLDGLLRTLKNEIVAVDPWARVNLVEPGWVVTPMTDATLAVPGTASRAVRTMPLRQLARPEDVARAVLFFASPTMARHVTGERLAVAGGMEGRVLWDEAQLSDEEILRRTRG